MYSKIRFKGLDDGWSFQIFSELLSSLSESYDTLLKFLFSSNSIVLPWWLAQFSGELGWFCVWSGSFLRCLGKDPYALLTTKGIVGSSLAMVAHSDICGIHLSLPFFCFFRLCWPKAALSLSRNVIDGVSVCCSSCHLLIFSSQDCLYLQARSEPLSQVLVYRKSFFVPHCREAYKLNPYFWYQHMARFFGVCSGQQF